MTDKEKSSLKEMELRASSMLHAHFLSTNVGLDLVTIRNIRYTKIMGEVFFPIIRLGSPDEFCMTMISAANSSYLNHEEQDAAMFLLSRYQEQASDHMHSRIGLETVIYDL